MRDHTIVTELPDGWKRIKVPLPFSLKWVNSYIIPEESGYTIVDPGLRTDEAVEIWDETFKDCGMEWRDIVRIVLTHQHPDHYGLAGYMQQKSGAPVLMTERSHRYARRLWGGNHEYGVALSELFISHGMPEELMLEIRINLDGFVERVSPQPEITYMRAGDKLNMNGRDWELIDAPGHAYGAVCLYDNSRRWIICGDQVLPHITPNISVVPGEERDPLADFLHNLEQLAHYHVELALPGHRDPFTDFRGRIGELQAFHGRRLADMQSRLAEKPQHAFELCESLFGTRLRTNPHNLRFAMAETLAHLFHLELQGVITSSEQDGYRIFAVAGTATAEA
ncbi:MBL fold metallo-hydrolase [Paenibacillus sp. strain BS8-2]